MSAASNAGSLAAERARRRQAMQVEETIREGKAASDLAYRGRLLAHRELWGMFPVAKRPFYIAQRKLCAICFELMPITIGDGDDRATWDHVIPRVLGGGGLDKRNKVLAHRRCNVRKAHRSPTACELFFCAVTNEIVFSLERAL